MHETFCILNMLNVDCNRSEYANRETCPHSAGVRRRLISLRNVPFCASDAYLSQIVNTAKCDSYTGQYVVDVDATHTLANTL